MNASVQMEKRPRIFERDLNKLRTGRGLFDNVKVGHMSLYTLNQVVSSTPDAGTIMITLLKNISD